MRLNINTWICNFIRVVIIDILKDLYESVFINISAFLDFISVLLDIKLSHTFKGFIIFFWYGNFWHQISGVHYIYFKLKWS